MASTVDSGSIEQDDTGSPEQEFQDCTSDDDHGDGQENNSDENHDETERIRGDLLKGMQRDWEEVVRMYEKNPRVGKVKLDNTTGNTALHLAVLSGRGDIVKELVDVLISRRNEEDLYLEILSQPNNMGNIPLHLAAIRGSIETCKCVIGGYKQLLGIRNSRSRTPLHMAAIYGKTETFFGLYEIYNTAQAQGYCQAADGTTVVHSAIANQHWDLAFQIIHRHESLMDFVDNHGFSPLHVLAGNPAAFRSGTYLSFFDSIIYHCIYVEELIPGIWKEKKKHENLRHPKNYEAFINFFQGLWKLIKFPGGENSTQQLDAQNLEEGQGHHSSNEAKGHQGFPSRCRIFFRLIRVIASTIVLVIFSIILGTSKVRKLKGIKEKHIWCLQIMKKLIDYAQKHEPATNNQSSGSSCHSAYGYFKRGGAKVTPILLAAENGVVEMVEKILEAFPMAILDADSSQMCIAQAVVEKEQFHIYDFLVRYHHIVERSLIFDFMDSEFNTALHIAAMPHENDNCSEATSMLRLQWKVKWYEYVENSMSPDFASRENNNRERPDDIFIKKHKDLLHKSKAWMDSTCNTCSFIAAIIATVAFSSSATVPGGVNQDTGIPLFQHHLAFRFFAISSLLALCSSFTSLLIFFTILTSKYQYKDFSKNLPLSLFLGLTSLFMSMVAMLVCFCSGHFLMLDDHLKYFAIPVYALTLSAVAYFSLQQFPSFFVLMVAVFQRVPRRVYREDSF